MVACLNRLYEDKDDLRGRIAALTSRNIEIHGTVTETFAVVSQVIVNCVRRVKKFQVLLMRLQNVAVSARTRKSPITVA